MLSTNRPRSLEILLPYLEILVNMTSKQEFHSRELAAAYSVICNHVSEISLRYVAAVPAAMPSQWLPSNLSKRSDDQLDEASVCRLQDLGRHSSCIDDAVSCMILPHAPRAAAEEHVTRCRRSLMRSIGSRVLYFAQHPGLRFSSYDALTPRLCLQADFPGCVDMPGVYEHVRCQKERRSCDLRMGRSLKKAA